MFLADKENHSAVHKEREQRWREWLQFSNGWNEQDGRDKREGQGHSIGLALSALSCFNILWINTLDWIDIYAGYQILLYELWCLDEYGWICESITWQH